MLLPQSWVRPSICTFHICLGTVAPIQIFGALWKIPKGITIHYVDEGIDTGDIIAQRLVDLDVDANTLASSYSKLQLELQTLFKETWSSIRTSTCTRRVQPAGGGYHLSRDKDSLSRLLTNGWETPVSILRDYAAEVQMSANFWDKNDRELEAQVRDWKLVSGAIQQETNPGGIVVLAHLMNQDGDLSTESRARSDKAAELAKQYGCPVVCMGWNYRKDTELCVSEAIARYLRSAHGIEESRLMIDRESRDTVGDAVLSKRQFLNLLPTKHVFVVTSDYHVDRTRQVFEFVYGGDARISVVGVATDAGDKELLHEQDSLTAFYATFAGVKVADDNAILETLAKRHSFYNGVIFPILL